MQCYYVTERADSALIRAMREAGFLCRVLGLAELDWALSGEVPDLLILDDEGLGAGARLITGVRRRARVPLAVLVRTDDGVRRARLLRAGADVCLAPPVSMRELEALVQRFLRPRPVPARSHPPPSGEEGLMLVQRSRRVSWQGQELKVSAREFELLRLLLQAGGMPVSREAIWAKLWPEHREPAPGLIDLAVSRLRKKLQPSALQIMNERNFGYRVAGKFSLL